MVDRSRLGEVSHCDRCDAPPRVPASSNRLNVSTSSGLPEGLPCPAAATYTTDTDILNRREAFLVHLRDRQCSWQFEFDKYQSYLTSKSNYCGKRRRSL